MEPTEVTATFEVFFDGDCPLCAREIALLRRLDEKGRIRFTDIATDSFQAASVGMTFERLMGSIHGRSLVPGPGSPDGRGTPDGEDLWVEGVEVFRQLYGAVGFGPLVRLSRLPVLSSVLDLAYRVFAAKRLALTGRCTAESCDLSRRADAASFATATP